MHHQIREFKLDNLKKRVSAGYLTINVWNAVHVLAYMGAKFANDRVFVSFLAKWVSNYQFEKNLKQVLLTSSAKIMFKTCQSKKKHVVMSSLFYISSKIPSSIHATQVKLEAVGSSVCSSIVFEQNPRLLEPAFGILIV